MRAGRPRSHRPGRLPVQQPLVLFILCILCIDVNNPFSGDAWLKQLIRNAAFAPSGSTAGSALSPRRCESLPGWLPAKSR